MRQEEERYMYMHGTTRLQYNSNALSYVHVAYTLQCTMVQYSTVKYSTVQYSTVQYSEV